MELSLEEIRDIIEDEVVVDCYDEVEFNMGWAIYMGDHIHYPFDAEYLVRKRSGEHTWESVRVVGNETDESNFSLESYYVEIEFEDMITMAELEELRNIQADETTLRTLQVWKHRNKA